MAINLTDDAVHALNRAAAVAAREDEEAITPRHVLAGVLSQRDSALLDILGELSLEIDALPEPMRDAPSTYGGHLPFTPPAHEVLAAAIESSTADGQAATDSTYLALGVAKARDAEVHAVLEQWGMDAADFAAALKKRSADGQGGDDGPGAE